MSTHQRSHRAGFTLIELLVVIAIVGILAGLLMAFVNPVEQLAKSRDAKRKSELVELQKALELYYQDYGAYPGSTDGKIIGTSGEIAWGTGGFTPYIAKLPKDPSGGKQYFYASTGQSYYLFASLDRGDKDDSACTQDGSACPAALSVGANCGNQPCNYGVSSPNVSVSGN
jgi:type II secretion system protein G